MPILHVVIPMNIELLVIPTMREAQRRNLLSAGAGNQQLARRIRSSE
jgi:hypothetical protein